MLVRGISGVNELFPVLYDIGSYRDMLPIELRGWTDALGLNVRLWLEYPGTDCLESLAAGGRYRKYFYATCYYDLSNEKNMEKMTASASGDFSHWEIQRFDKETWVKRFAHLVKPTREIVWYLSIPNKEDLMKTYGSKRDIENFKTESLPRLQNAVRHFNLTGEWCGLHDHKCMSCGQDIYWWTFFYYEPCPYCSNTVRE